MKKSLMANPTLYTILAVLSFIISGAVTVMLFVSTSSGIIGTVLMFLTALVFELSKCTLLYQAFRSQLNVAFRITFGCLWLGVTIASIVASAGFVISQERETRNITIENSAEYSQQEENRKLKQDLYNQKKNELEQLQGGKNKIISDMEKVRDSWGKNYITMRGNEQAKINSKDAELTAEINKKSSELSQIASDLSTPPSEIKPQLENTNGYNAIFELMAESLNKNNPRAKKDPYKAEVLQMWFFILLGVGLEILGNVFIFLSQYYQNVSFSPTPINPDPEKKPVPILESNINNTQTKEIQGGRLQGMRYKVKAKNKVTGCKPSELKPVITLVPKAAPTPPSKYIGFTNKDLEKYIEYMFDNTTSTKNGLESPGITAISKANINLSYKTCRAIHGYLSTLGAIQTQGKATVILKSKSDLLCTVKQAI